MSTLRRKVSLGQKPEKMETTINTQEIRYPSMYISDRKLPLGFDDAGKKFQVQATVKLTGVSQHSRNKGKASYDFEIHDITFIKSE